MRDDPLAFEDDTPTVELPAITVPMAPVQPATAPQQTWRVTPTEVDAMASVSSPAQPSAAVAAESERERRRRELNQYRRQVWDRRFVAWVRWLYSRVRTAVYITVVLMLPGLLFRPIRGYLDWVMIANLGLVGVVAVSLVAGEVTSRQPQWSCMFGALFRLLMVGGFAIACSYVSDADPWKAVVGPLLRFAGSWGLQILTLVDHAVVMVLGALLARGSLRSLAEGGKIHLEGMSRFGTRPGWTLKAQSIGTDPREQPGWATAPSIFAYRRALFRFYLGQVRVLITCVYVSFLMFVIASA